jgi:hypothetical protein
VQLLHSPEASGLPAEILFVLDASAGAGVRDEAEVAVRSKGSDYTRLVAPTLWLVGTWESSRGNRASLDAISRALASKVDSTHARRDSLLLAAIVARAAEASGDTAQAIALMSRLTPTGNDADLEWQPWESLAAERIALGRLLVARGAFDRAEAATSSLDSPWPNSNLLYRRAGLQLRIRAAQGAHDGALETRLTEQLHRLSSGSSPVVSP